MASVSQLGAGTSLDLDSLYNSLEAAEQKRLSPLTKQQTSYTAKLTAWGIVQTSLEKVQAAASALKDTSAIATSKVVSSNSSFTASLANGTSAGNFKVNVTQLAEAQSLLSETTDSSTKALGSSASSIFIEQNGKKTEIKIAANKTSLNDIRDAINQQSTGVNASVIKADDNSYYLSLTSKETGEANTMKISVTGDQAISDFLSYDGNANNTQNGMKQQVAAKNAELTVNGIAITRSSNTITDVPEGVTLTLTSISGKEENLSIQKDSAPMLEAVKAYVDAYNSLQTTITSQTKYTAVKKGADEQNASNGDLVGDGTLRSIQSGLRSLISTTQNGGDISLLSQLGIKQETTGKLSVDNSKLEKALNEDPDSVMKFLSGDGKTTGFATQTSNLLTEYLGSDGAIKTATNGIDKSIKLVKQRSEQMVESINATMARYKTQFVNLSRMVSQMTNTSNYLAQQFSQSSK